MQTHGLVTPSLAQYQPTCYSGNQKQDPEVWAPSSALPTRHHCLPQLGAESRLLTLLSQFDTLPSLSWHRTQKSGFPSSLLSPVGPLHSQSWGRTQDSWPQVQPPYPLYGFFLLRRDLDVVHVGCVIAHGPYLTLQLRHITPFTQWLIQHLDELLLVLADLLWEEEAWG